jgi:hypothetical protein
MRQEHCLAPTVRWLSASAVFLLAGACQAGTSESIETAIRACTEAGTSVETRFMQLDESGWVHLTDDESARALSAMETVASYGGTEFKPPEGTLADFFDAQRKTPIQLRFAAGRRVTQTELSAALESRSARFALQHSSPPASLDVEVLTFPDGSMVMKCNLAATGNLDGGDARALLASQAMAVVRDETEQTSFGATRHNLRLQAESSESDASIEFYDFTEATELHTFFNERGVDNTLTSLMSTGLHPVTSEASQ